MNFNIDFVVTWVDGSDPVWLKKRRQVDSRSGDKQTLRYRDYGVFKYWFRAVQKYAPWVHRVYLVTDNQVPVWLNMNNSKLRIIDHSQIIPSSALPTFNSNSIELNVFKIKELSEHFVLFNDDMFLNAPVKKSDFFSSKGLPKDMAVQNAIMPIEDFDYISVNNIKIINQHFSKSEVLKTQLFKFFNFKYGYYNILSILLLPWPRFTRFLDPHVPVSLLKSIFKNVIEENTDSYKKTVYHKFRSKEDNSFWLVRYYQLVLGKFKPRFIGFGKKYNFNEINAILKDIKRHKHKVICVNDVELSTDEFKRNSDLLLRSLNNNLKNKSSFEK